MSGIDFDPDDEEQVEEMLTSMREHMLADHAVRVLDEGEITQFIAAQLAVMRATADALDAYAVVLRVVPDMHKTIAEELITAAKTLRGIVPSEGVGA